jgi:hypothetical protein
MTTITSKEITEITEAEIDVPAQQSMEMMGIDGQYVKQEQKENKEDQEDDEVVVRRARQPCRTSDTPIADEMQRMSLNNNHNFVNYRK